LKWKWTDHVVFQMKERNIQRNYVEKTLSKPDEIVESKNGRKIYQKIFNKRLLRVIVEDNKVITAYFTTKISKYFFGGENK